MSTPPDQAIRDDGPIALVLSGAGSRGAFEAGALSVLLPTLADDNDFPQILVGTSAGALNAAVLAQHLDKGVGVAADKLVDAWMGLRPENVFRRPFAGALHAAAWHLHHKWGTASGLVDTSRLGNTILGLAGDFHSKIGNSVKALAVIASSCSTNRPVAFVDVGPPPGGGAIPQSGSALDYRHAQLGVDHLLASSAFPIAFPPKWIAFSSHRRDGDWFIDGGVHLNTPLKPALDLGAGRLLVVGGTSTNGSRPASPAGRQAPVLASPDVAPDIVDAGGQLLQALNVDKMMTDLAHLDRTNKSVNALQGAGIQTAHRYIKTFVVNPTNDGLSEVAARVWPARRSKLITGFGGYHTLGPLLHQRQHPGQLLSYLCFEEEFIEEAIELGRQRALAALGGNATIPWT